MKLVKIFSSFLIVMSVAILFMLPVTEGIYDYRTDVREEPFTIVTGIGATTGNMTLHDEVYDDDTATISVISDNTSDTPVFSNYATATRELEIAGLAASDTRILTIEYDVDALNTSSAVNVFMDRLAWIWLLCVIAFAPAAIAAIFMNKA